MKEIIEHSQIELPKSLKTVLWAFVLLGAGMFVIGLATGNEEGITRTWQTLLDQRNVLGRYCPGWCDSLRNLADY